jgi:hypothetical protein
MMMKKKRWVYVGTQTAHMMVCGLLWTGCAGLLFCLFCFPLLLSNSVADYSPHALLFFSSKRSEFSMLPYHRTDRSYFPPNSPEFPFSRM